LILVLFSYSVNSKKPILGLTLPAFKKQLKLYLIGNP